MTNEIKRIFIHLSIQKDFLNYLDYKKLTNKLGYEIEYITKKNILSFLYI